MIVFFIIKIILILSSSLLNAIQCKYSKAQHFLNLMATRSNDLLC